VVGEKEDQNNRQKKLNERRIESINSGVEEEKEEVEVLIGEEKRNKTEGRKEGRKEEVSIIASCPLPKILSSVWAAGSYFKREDPYRLTYSLYTCKSLT
jgi:hypothetical protein